MRCVCQRPGCHGLQQVQVAPARKVKTARAYRHFSLPLQIVRVATEFGGWHRAKQSLLLRCAMAPVERQGTQAVLPRLPIWFSLLYSVFRLMPSCSAALGLLP